MTTDQVTQAADLIDEISVLDRVIDDVSVDVQCFVDWSHRSDEHPYRQQMIHAVRDAKMAARAVIESAAKRHIANLRAQLQALGVRDDKSPTP